MDKGFTIIELIVSVTIIAALSAIVLFSITQYIGKGKDANVAGNLAVLIPAGEVFYYGNVNTYQNFCSSTVVVNAESKMPQNSSGDCAGNPAGVCCNVSGSSQNYQSWSSCAKKNADNSKAFCVDSRGVQEEIDNSLCNNSLTQCP